MAPPVSERCKLFEEQAFYTGAETRRPGPLGKNAVLYTERHEGPPYLTVQIVKEGVFVSSFRRQGEERKTVRSCAYRFSIKAAEYKAIAKAIDDELGPDSPLLLPDRQRRLRSIARGCHVLRGASLLRVKDGRETFDTTTCNASGPLVNKAREAIKPLLARHGASMSE